MSLPHVSIAAKAGIRISGLIADDCLPMNQPVCLYLSGIQM